MITMFLSLSFTSTFLSVTSPGHGEGKESPKAIDDTKLPKQSSGIVENFASFVASVMALYFHRPFG